MGRRHKGAAPSMRRHRGKNLAYVYHDGRQIYLGPWNAPETRRAYREWVGRWEAAQAVQDAPAATVGKGTGICCFRLLCRVPKVGERALSPGRRHAHFDGRAVPSGLGADPRGAW
jgi:hypothetical protein